KFSQDILKDIEQIGGDEAVQAVLTARKEREESELTSALMNKSFEEKIDLLYKLQDEKGYMHEIEKTASEDYLVRNYNCSYLSLALSDRNICDNEKEMYRQIVPDSDVQANKYMTRGEKYCSWTITNPKNKR